MLLPLDYLLELWRLVKIPGSVCNLNDCNWISVILEEWGIKLEIILAYWKIKLHFLHSRAFELWFIPTILTYPEVLEIIMSEPFIFLVDIAVFLQGTNHLKTMSKSCLKTLWLLFPAKYGADSLSRVLGIFFIIYPQTCLPLLS